MRLFSLHDLVYVWGCLWWIAKSIANSTVNKPGLVIIRLLFSPNKRVMRSHWTSFTTNFACLWHLTPLLHHFYANHPSHLVILTAWLLYCWCPVQLVIFWIKCSVWRVNLATILHRISETLLVGIWLPAGWCYESTIPISSTLPLVGPYHVGLHFAG